jgi:hypothetical protein
MARVASYYEVRGSFSPVKVTTPMMKIKMNASIDVLRFILIRGAADWMSMVAASSSRSGRKRLECNFVRFHREFNTG